MLLDLVRHFTNEVYKMYAFFSYQSQILKRTDIENRTDTDILMSLALSKKTKQTN